MRFVVEYRIPSSPLAKFVCAHSLTEPPRPAAINIRLDVHRYVWDLPVFNPIPYTAGG